MLKGYMWKYDIIKKRKKRNEGIGGIWTLRIMENKWISAASDSTYWAKQPDIKQFSKLHLTAEYKSVMFWLQCLQTSKCKHGHNSAVGLYMRQSACLVLNPYTVYSYVYDGGSGLRLNDGPDVKL